MPMGDHDAVRHLIRASDILKTLPGSHVVDRAVSEVGQAIYGRNVVTERDARQHIRAALSLLQLSREKEKTKAVRSALRAALKALGTD